MNLEINGRLRGSLGSIPPLSIDTSKKTEKYYENVLDALEYIGVTQYLDNTKYEDILRMIRGKQSIKEAREFVPYLKNLSPDIVESSIPNYIRHYDLIGQIINATAETYMITRDDFQVRAIDELTTNEFIRTRTHLMNRYTREEFQKELALRMEAEGLQLDLDLLTFENEEEEQAYRDYIARRQDELTPEGVDQYMKNDYRTNGVLWADATLRNDSKRFGEENMIREMLTEYLASGKVFCHLFVGHDYYEPQVWSIREAFFSKEHRLKYPHKGEYVGRITFKTLSQLLSTYGDILPEKLISKLTKQQEAGNNKWSLLPPQLTTPFNSDKPTLYPSDDYPERMVTANLENMFKVPLTSFLVEDDCKTMSVPGFASTTFNGKTPATLYRQTMMEDTATVRYDVYQVTEVYFRDYQKTGLICLENEYGYLVYDYVTDDILSDFIKEMGITQIKTKSLKEMESNPEPNTITWFYTPYSRKGIKIDLQGVNEQAFYYTEKTPYQIRGTSEMFEIWHPVASYVGDGMGDRLENTQAMFNLNMNQLQDITEKEVGMFFLFDYAFLQSDGIENGKSQEAMELALTLAKSLGFIGINSAESGFREAMSSGQFMPVNMTLTEQMQSRMQNAMFYQQQAYNLIGIKLGQGAPADGYKTNEGVRIDREAMYAQLEHYFGQFTDFLREKYTIQLAVSQYCQTAGKDNSATYIQSDGGQSYIQFTDPNFPVRLFGVYPMSNAQERKQKQMMEQLFLSNNTITDDPFTIAKVLTSSTVSDMIAATRENREYKERIRQSQQQQNMNLIAQQEESDRNKTYFKWALEEESRKKDRENRLLVEGIDAMGRALYRSPGTQSTNAIEQQVNDSIKQEQLRVTSELGKEKNMIRMTEAQTREALEKRKLDQIDRKMDLQEARDRANITVAALNTSR